MTSCLEKGDSRSSQCPYIRIQDDTSAHNGVQRQCVVERCSKDLVPMEQFRRITDGFVGAGIVETKDESVSAGSDKESLDSENPDIFSMTRSL